ncbi:MAG: GNAT family N-acetyltransferase [Pseudomonadota bacterium]
MTGITVRRAKDSEYRDLADIWMRAWQSAGLAHPNDLGFDALLDLFSNEAEHVWDLHVADLDGELAGFLALKREERKIDQLFVAPEVQGNGVGLYLLNIGKQILPEGLWLRTAEQNHNALRFYERNDFTFQRREARPEYDRFDIVLKWSP